MRALPLLVLVTGCADHHVDGIGEFGRPITLMTGDDSPLLRLAFRDEGCPGPVGGCPSASACPPILIDSLAPVTAIRRSSTNPEVRIECLEVRAAGGLAAPVPAAQDLDRAVARFRFDEVPVVRAALGGGDGWTWSAGDGDAPIDPAAVLGGNVLRDFGIRIRSDQGVPTITFYGSFPGSDPDLAAQGRAYLPVQFPGRLLGKEAEDRCEVGDHDCALGLFDLEPGQEALALVPTRMVMDACVATPPCALAYTPAADPLAAGTCGLTPGPDMPPAAGGERTCVSAVDGLRGGVAASLVLATGVPGLVLFDDSALRMFGPLSELPSCSGDVGDARACFVDQAGVLHLAGWPSAGTETPLIRLRVRSLALAAGATTRKSPAPCVRVQSRLDGLALQCEAYRQAAAEASSILDVAPPFGGGGRSEDSTAVLGESFLPAGRTSPDPATWISTYVVSAAHPSALAIRRDVSPDAIQPDGLLGTALMRDTEVILDYTDANPGLRVKCLDPRSGTCTVAPTCRGHGNPSCCYGLPLGLLDEMINIVGEDTCCGALSAPELAEVKDRGEHCQGFDPP